MTTNPCEEPLAETPPSSASSQPTPQTTINVTDFVGIDADNVVSLTTARQDVPEQSTSVRPQRIDSPQTQQVSQEKETVGVSENIGKEMHAPLAAAKHNSADLRMGSVQEKQPDPNASVATPKPHALIPLHAQTVPELISELQLANAASNPDLKDFVQP